MARTVRLGEQRRRWNSSELELEASFEKPWSRGEKAASCSLCWPDWPEALRGQLKLIWPEVSISGVTPCGDFFRIVQLMRHPQIWGWWLVTFVDLV